MAHKTTINLRDDLYLKVRSLAEREGVAVGDVVNRLIARALETGDERRFTSFGAGEADTDLGLNAEKYLREGLA